MSKLFETSDEYVELIENQFAKTGLDTMGINMKVGSTPKAKTMLKVTRIPSVANFINENRNTPDILVTVYEQAFDRLTPDIQNMLVEMILSTVYYDTEKDKLIIENDPYKPIFAMRRKYGEVILDNLETAQLTIQQIEDEEKERKEAEKEAKKAKRKSN